MPNRILREGILTSERIATLSWPAEVFYRRLMSVVDDFGRYHATPMLLRAACYPLQLDIVRDADIPRWLAECEKAGLILVYDGPRSRCLEMRDFRQQVRAQGSKFPAPPVEMRSSCVADAQQMPSSSAADAHLDVDVFECEGGRKSSAHFDGFWAAYPGPRKVGKAKCRTVWQTHGFDSVADQIALHIEAMKLTPQWRDQDGKFIPAPLTYLNQRRFEDGVPEAPKPRLVI